MLDLFVLLLQSGKIANELEHVSHNVRSKLDEIKRREIERLRLAAIKHVIIDLIIYRFINITEMFCLIYRFYSWNCFFFLLCSMSLPMTWIVII